MAKPQASFSSRWRHRLVAGQRVELRRGNTKAEQRRRLVGKPAHEAVVEHRGQLFLEHAALFLQRRRGQDFRQVDAVKLRQKVRHADEVAEQPALVDALAEAADAAASGQVAAFPVATADIVEVRGHPFAIGRDVGAAVGIGEEAPEQRMAGQVAGRGELEPVQRDMRGVEIDGGDRLRIGDEIGQHVAAAAGDGDHAAVGANLQSLHVHFGIFPDLGVDEAPKREGKRVIQQAVGHSRTFADHRTGNRMSARSLQHCETSDIANG